MFKSRSGQADRDNLDDGSGPPTDLGTIYVVGQRRRPGGLFPSGSGGSGGGSDIPPDVAQEAEEDDQGGGSLPLPPCSDPETALEWNADAAAAEAAKELARLAAARTPPESINQREWGAFLYRNSDGSIRIGPINSGREFQSGGVGSVVLIRDGLDSDIVGFVHNHRSGSHLPSDGPDQDNPGDIQVLEQLIQATENPDLRMYIVAQNQGSAGFTPYNQINVYNASNARSARDSFTPGPEVNPEASPCPEI